MLYLLGRYQKELLLSQLFEHLGSLQIHLALSLDEGDELVFVARALGCIPVGILLSYIPALKPRKFNVSVPAVVLLIPTLFYFAYNEKTFFIRLLMIALFGALMYFSCNIPVGGRVFDLLGQLSVRIYLYMAVLTMLRIFGITNYRMLCVIDLFVASLDLMIHIYRQKYKAQASKA